MWTRLPVLILAALTPAALFAQAPAKPLPGDERIDAYLKQQTERLSGRFLDGAKTLEEWQKKRPQLKQQ